MNFIVDADVKLCFDGVDGDCQLTVTIMKNTYIPQPGCNPSAVSYFNGERWWCGSYH